jgi:hypothetical protein
MSYAQTHMLFFLHLGIILMLVLGFYSVCLVELGRCIFSVHV